MTFQETECDQGKDSQLWLTHGGILTKPDTSLSRASVSPYVEQVAGGSWCLPAWTL